MQFHDDIIKMAKENTFFRRVLSTTQHSQVVIMSIPPGGEIGEEVHGYVDQTLYFIEGTGKAILDDVPSDVGPEHLVVVPAGTKHNFTNTGATDLKLFTVYAPPEHKDGTVHETKAAAEVDKEDHP